jgi:molybdopterin converting factor subunit 1
MRVTIRLFARLRELAGCAELAGELPEGATVREAWELLLRQFPAVAEYETSLSAAVNVDYARFTTRLRDGDEVSFLPPVSGGSGTRELGSGLGIRASGLGGVATDDSD